MLEEARLMLGAEVPSSDGWGGLYRCESEKEQQESPFFLPSSRLIVKVGKKAELGL